MSTSPAPARLAVALASLWAIGVQALTRTAQVTRNSAAAPMTASGDEWYQAFLDEMPVLRYHGPRWAEWKFGKGQAKRVPALFSRFDWRFGLDADEVAGDQRGRDPRTVIAAGEAVHKLLSIAEKDFDSSHADRVVVFVCPREEALSEAFGQSAGERNATARRLRRFFGTVFYEVEDVQLEGVRTMPIALSEAYFRRGAAAAAQQAIAAARVDAAAKPLGVLAAWGRFNSLLQVDKAEHPSRRTPRPGFDSPVWLSIKRLAHESRAEAAAWSRSPAGVAAGADLRRLAPRDYWRELSRYRFMLSPFGTSIHSAKALEALLVLTVPIVLRGPYPVNDELVRMGFPMVVVDRWSDVTPSLLEAQWEALAPRLESFRRNCLSAEAYWRIFTSGAGRCE